MEKNEYIAKYNQNLFDDIKQELIKLFSLKGLHVSKKYGVIPTIIKPSINFEFLGESGLINLINLYSSKCCDYKLDSESGYELQNEFVYRKTFKELDIILWRLMYTNIVKLKNKETHKDLEVLYLTNYVIDYSKSIEVKHKKSHIFNISKFEDFKHRVKAEFEIGIQTFPDGSGTSFDAEKMYLDLSGRNGLFWKYCTINKVFDEFSHSINFTRCLHDFLAYIDNVRISRFPKKNVKTIKLLASSGGFARAEKYRQKMNPIFDSAYKLFIDRNPQNKKTWKSKSECAKYFIKDFYQNNPESDLDLDPKTIVKEITIRINDHCASR